ncbi:MAG: matrixin family metalloprotease [Nanoarchaeota archaeon]
MNILNALLVAVFFIVFLGGFYFLWTTLKAPSVDFEAYKSNFSQDLPLKSSQFYPNMRYPDKKIIYELEKNCTEKRKNDAREAFKILEEKTILEFEEGSDPQISISCSNIAPTLEQETHFIAGEGGPVEIINTSRYSVILLGRISLYRPENCKNSQIAIHEILHALGFDHNNNEKSIMYPITNCGQEIDDYIIKEINEVYKAAPQSDLLIEELKANTTRGYLNFEATITNHGLKDSEESSLVITTENTKIETFPLENIEIGTKRKIRVTNLKMPRKYSKITFLIESSEYEISKENNQIILQVAESNL